MLSCWDVIEGECGTLLPFGICVYFLSASRQQGSRPASTHQTMAFSNSNYLQSGEIKTKSVESVVVQAVLGKMEPALTGCLWCVRCSVPLWSTASKNNHPRLGSQGHVFPGVNSVFMVLDNRLNHSKPQFPCLQNGKGSKTGTF